MNLSLRQESFQLCRRSQQCQTILYKTALDHCAEIHNIAALCVTSKSLQNSSFGADILSNIRIDYDSHRLFDVLLSPSSCFAVQFVSSLYIEDAYARYYYSEEVANAIANIASEFAKTEYLPRQLRELALIHVPLRTARSMFVSSISWSNLQSLDLGGSETDDSLMAVICTSAVHLTNLQLTFCSKISDDSLKCIATLSKLTDLNLNTCYQISDVGLEHLSSLAAIRTLNLHDCNKIGDVGLKSISALSNITSLDLGGRKKMLTDVGLQHICNLTSICTLNLSGCKKFSDAGLQVIAQNLVAVKTLELFGCFQVTDVGLQHISSLGGITNLDLGRCTEITDVGIEYISKLRGISHLNLLECRKVSGEAAAKFKADHPNCSFYS